MSQEVGRVTNSPISTGVKQVTQLLSGLKKEKPLPQEPDMGFFTDTSLCIGCKACEVACKQWNQLPATTPDWTGTSYDNTQALGATTWRHVQFIEQFKPPLPVPEISEPAAQTTVGLLNLPLFDPSVDDPIGQSTGTALPFFSSNRWLMHSDVCKHCANAPCQEACPTGAIIHTEFNTVYVQQDICNGCGYCVVACPFNVIARDAKGADPMHKGDGQAHKCTLCYDRLKDGMEPACAKACPTDSIQFGEVGELKRHAQERVGQLQALGVKDAALYGADDTILEGGLHSFFLIMDEPEVYNLPRNPARPSKHVLPASLGVVVTAGIISLIGSLIFRQD